MHTVGDRLMAQKVAERRRVKISATIDADLLATVDAFVEGHAEFDRSKVLNEALRLWYERQQEQAIEAQHRAPQDDREREEHAAWRRIQAAAAERIFRPRSTDQ